MKVGYAVLYSNGILVISANPIKQFKKFSIFSLRKNIYKDYGEFDDDNVPWKKTYDKIKTVQILDQVKSNCMKNWFENCINLTTLIDFQNLDVSECEDFSYLFFNCKLLTNISSLKDWDVSNGKNFDRMFFACQSLTDISVLGNWQMSNGKDFITMFGNCTNLRKIQLPNTLKSLNYQMFEGCSPMLQICWKDKIYIYDDLKEYQEF